MRVRDMTLSSLFTALMVVGAFVKIPLPGLPVTLQPFFCALAGILLGARLGLLSQLLYIAMGLIGIPVFTKGGGVGYIFEPSFGYILGFAAGAYVIGKISEALGKMSMKNALISLMAGLIVIYAVGIPYTYMILRVYMNQPGAVLISTAMLPFIVKDFVLFVVIAVAAQTLVPIVKRSQLPAR